MHGGDGGKHVGRFEMTLKQSNVQTWGMTEKQGAVFLSALRHFSKPDPKAGDVSHGEDCLCSDTFS